MLNIVCLAGECQKCGLPLIVESIQEGRAQAEMRTPQTVAAALVASETGADYV